MDKRIKNIFSQKLGFSQVELLITVAIIIILASGVVLAINPLRKMAEARDNRRQNHLNAVWNAVEQKIYNDKGWENCPDLPTEDYQPIGRGEGMYDLYSCIYPEYLSKVVVDPKDGSKSGDRVGMEDSYYWSFNNSLASDNKNIEPVDGSIITFRPNEGQYGQAIAIDESTTNIILYPDFSSGVSPYSVQDVTVLDDSESYTEKSLKIEFTGTHGANRCQFDEDSFTIDDTYTFSIYAKGTESTVGKQLQSYSGSSWYHSDKTLTRDWQRFTFVMTVGDSSGGPGNIGLEGEEVGDVFYVHSPQLEHKSFATSFVADNRERGELKYKPSDMEVDLNSSNWTVGGWFKPGSLTMETDSRSALFELGSYYKAGETSITLGGRHVIDGLRLTAYEDKGNDEHITKSTFLTSSESQEWMFIGLTYDEPTLKIHTVSNESGHQTVSVDFVWDDPIRDNIFVGGYGWNTGNYNGLIDEFLTLPYTATDQQIKEWGSFKYDSKYSIWKNPLSGKVSLKSTTGETRNLSAGDPGSALSFDGSNDDVSVSDDDNLDMGTSDFTISSWFNTSNTSDHQNIITKGGTGTNGAGYRLSVNRGGVGDIWVAVSGGDGSHRPDCIIGDGYTDGKWHMVNAKFNRSEDEIIVYVDGDNIGTCDITNISGQSLDNDRNFYIVYSSTQYFDGKIDDVRVYNRLLTEEEIEDLYHNKHITNGLVGYWPFNNMEGCEAEDLSGYSNHGVLQPNCPDDGPEWTTGR